MYSCTAPEEVYYRCEGFASENAHVQSEIEVSIHVTCINQFAVLWCLFVLFVFDFMVCEFGVLDSDL